MRWTKLALLVCTCTIALSTFEGCQTQDAAGDGARCPAEAVVAAAPTVVAPAVAAVAAPQVASPTLPPDSKAAGAPFAKPGFTTLLEDGRLWVLREGEQKSEKHVTRIAAGPLGEPVTLKALSVETLDAYEAAQR